LGRLLISGQVDLYLVGQFLDYPLSLDVKGDQRIAVEVTCDQISAGQAYCGWDELLAVLGGVVKRAV